MLHAEPTRSVTAVGRPPDKPQNLGECVADVLGFVSITKVVRRQPANKGAKGASINFVNNRFGAVDRFDHDPASDRSRQNIMPNERN